jgi:hypothetical protein
MMTQHPSLLDTDRELLGLLQEESRQTPSMLFEASETTPSKQYVQDRLAHLREHDLAERVDRGIYQLTERGERAADHLDRYRDDRDAFWSAVED